MGKSRFTPKFNIKKGDMVVVMAGNTPRKDKDGKYIARKVLEVYYDKAKVLVEGAGMVTKHRKPDAKNPEGGIEKVESPIAISNVMLVDPKTGEPTRVSIRREGKKVERISKKSGEVI